MNFWCFSDIEGWTLKAKQIKKIQSAEMRFYRRMLRVSWREKRTDESKLKELGTKRELVNFIKKRKLSFIGHACRSKCSLMKDIMQGEVEGKRGRGRPRLQYIDKKAGPENQRLKYSKPPRTEMAGGRPAVRKCGQPTFNRATLDSK